MEIHFGWCFRLWCQPFPEVPLYPYKRIPWDICILILFLLCWNLLLLVSVVYNQDSPNKCTQKDCNRFGGYVCSQNPIPYVGMYWEFHLLVSISIMTLSGWRLVFTIVLNPFIQKLQLKSAWKKQTKTVWASCAGNSWLLYHMHWFIGSVCLYLNV